MRNKTHHISSSFLDLDNLSNIIWLVSLIFIDIKDILITYLFFDMTAYLIRDNYLRYMYLDVFLGVPIGYDGF